MFDYTLAHWIAFFSAAVLLNLSPGPDMAYILGQAARGGVKNGMAAMFGIWGGAFLHVLLAALGLSAVLATSAIAFSMVKWLGAAYLIWLGIQALRTKEGAFPLEGGIRETGLWATFRQGLLVAALNPKVAIFFLAFLPQFIVDGAGPISAQLFLHGCLIIAVAALAEPPIIYLGAKLANVIKQHRHIGLWMERSLGAVLVALGIRLAVSER
ncbi:LysE family translocator [Halomonas sp. McH1-25]|uniref:LysE family translocator n=1 Tax=unclassified Halomonas TaxID=2609666 RepID=UPI001EF531D8|nr:MULTISPECIES: LysE family translocator [unclassified Halomonas]MCG7600227.1 LysE family translocator [Halomonas sp. McH1-25]MCP1343100.1 LysE family translocator [Halomonas sp. FL8]MCP1360491.1 LysE family translocator [Halomonas sp. BBD45]